MGRKPNYYLILDTETATLPFANSMCKTAKEKQMIAIAKPLVYDIGWVIATTKGEIITRKNYLVQETFFVPNVFNTAYYKDKRPIYIELLRAGAIETATWDNIIDDLAHDLRKVKMTCAYNACFDFKKAIPYTERYINALYSADYNQWELREKRQCEKILKGLDNSKNETYTEPTFTLRNENFPIVDLWGLACDRLINKDRYRNYCLENMLISSSGLYFKTSAEVCFQFIMQNYDFIEDHTALSDALIETEILVKALKKGSVQPQIKTFPFRELGETFKYVNEKKPEYKEDLIAFIENYLKTGNFSSNWLNRMIKVIEILQNN